MENWKDIKGYEGIYQVSDLGNVKSLPRMVPSPRGLSRFIKERILKTGSNNGGYLSVILCKDGIMKTKSIHQLVAESFLNHIPFGRELVVNHINFTREDNKLENLEIISFRQNTNKKHLKSSSKYTGVFWMKNKNGQDSYVCAVDCAKIAVNEITRENLVIDTGGISDAETVEKLNKRYNFWKEVKEELNKL